MKLKTLLLVCAFIPFAGAFAVEGSNVSTCPSTASLIYNKTTGYYSSPENGGMKSNASYSAPVEFGTFVRAAIQNTATCDYTTFGGGFLVMNSHPAHTKPIGKNWTAWGGASYTCLQDEPSGCAFKITQPF